MMSEVVGYQRQGSVAPQALERRHKDMPNEELKKQEILDEDEQFINSLLHVEDEEEEERKVQEAQRIKNKNAEEARKRREAEAKLAKDEEPEDDLEEEASEEVQEEKVEAQVVKTQVEEVKTKPKEDNVNRLGKQLVSFKQKYPEIDLEQLDQDKAFKRYIDGKLLGSKDFASLYEDFVEMKTTWHPIEKIGAAGSGY
jgi:hypothetical protein